MPPHEAAHAEGADLCVIDHVVGNGSRRAEIGDQLVCQAQDRFGRPVAPAHCLGVEGGVFVTWDKVIGDVRPCMGTALSRR